MAKLMLRLWVNILKDYKEIKTSKEIKSGILRQHLSSLIESYFKKAIQSILIKEGEINQAANVPHIFFKTVENLTIIFN